MADFRNALGENHWIKQHDKMEILRIEIAKLEMRPEDVLLIKLPPSYYGPDEVQAFTADINSEFPDLDLRVLILPDVATVEIVKKVE